MFFNFTFEQVPEDVAYILHQYFPEAAFPKAKLTLKVKRHTQSSIINLLNYKLFGKVEKNNLQDQAHKSMRVNGDTRYIFDTLLSYLENHKVSLPGYSTLQDIVTQAFVKEESRLGSIIKKHVPQYVDQILRNMLEGDGNMYGVTIFKKDAKGFNYNEVKKEIEKKNSSEKLYRFAAKTIPKLKIDENNILYYASLLDYYTVDRLCELSFESVRLYLLCYVFYRFQKINDNLVNSFVYYISNYQKKAKIAGKEQVYEHKISTNNYLQKAGEILDLFIDNTIPDGTPFSNVKSKAFSIVTEDQFPLFNQCIKGNAFDENEFIWNYYPKISRLTSKNLRPLVRAIDFESQVIDDPIIKALNFLKTTFDNGKSLTQLDQKSFPTDFIPSHFRSYLYEVKQKESNSDEKKELNVYKYEFLIYTELQKHMGSGRIFVNNSFSFKSLKMDLFDEVKWQQKDKILKGLGNTVLNTPIKEQLATFQEIIDPLILRVNQRIVSGENKELKVKRNGNWTLPYSKHLSEINNPFYVQLPQTSLNNLLRFVNEKCQFINIFTHIKSRYAKSQADDDGILACIIANATNHGISKMSEISDINYNKLLGTSKNFLRLENLKKANDIIANATLELPMFKRWNLMDNLIFSSLDGKKRQTKRRNIITRYSPKYFGCHKGVVSYSMIANNVCLNTKIIGANEHESHYLFDMTNNNTTDIKPDWLCGDSHSINHVNFALLHLIDQNFAPHLKKINQKSKHIYCFGDPSQYEGYLLVPEGKFKTKLIEDEWNNLQHIFVSLLLKKTTQSIVVKKLSSYERTNKTQKALWEFDKIIRIFHILRFIDDPVLRQCIRIALNRGEGFHQLTGAIANVGGSKFRGTTELELQIWNECMRLVANSIIYYNTLILSKIYSVQERKGNAQALEFIERLSPIAWRHINLSGRYEFANSLDDINLDEMIANLEFNRIDSKSRIDF